MTATRRIPTDWEQQAVQVKIAAEQGRWDDVQAYYTGRERWLSLAEGDQTLIGRLTAIDREIEAMITVAQAALTAAIGEQAAARRTVAQLRASMGTELETVRQVRLRL